MLAGQLTALQSPKSNTLRTKLPTGTTAEARSTAILESGVVLIRCSKSKEANVIRQDKVTGLRRFQPQIF